MHHDLSAPAQVMWHRDEERPPEDWSGAVRFLTLREALDASRRANAALRASRDDVSVRLDGAIERLSRVLGE